jgi:hypothetical protein
MNGNWPGMWMLTMRMDGLPDHRKRKRLELQREILFLKKGLSGLE